MLSRIAESLFWIGRYVERAEGTARLLDVHLQMLVEDPWVEEETACATLLNIMGCGEEQQPNRATVVRLLAYDESSPWSIARCLSGARENARRARETLSTELWEVLNTTWNTLPSGRWRASRDAIFFRWVRERTSLVAGVADGTMSRDEGWHFLMLGRSLERADMTARLVATTVVSRGPTAAWPTLLLACGAREVFLRTYRGHEADREAAEFILLDRLFPRSIVHALGQAEESLEQIAGLEQRVGMHDEALRVLGAARASLEYSPLTDVVVPAARADGAGAAGLRFGQRRDRGALLPGLGHDHLGGGEPVSTQGRDRAPHRLPVRRAGRRVVQRGSADADDDAGPADPAGPGRGAAVVLGDDLSGLLGQPGHGVRGAAAARAAGGHRPQHRRAGRPRAGP